MKRKFNQIDSSSQLTEQNEKCPICMDDLKTKNLTITKCGHKFCHTCLDAHSCNDFKCPICRYSKILRSLDYRYKKLYKYLLNKNS